MSFTRGSVDSFTMNTEPTPHVKTHKHTHTHISSKVAWPGTEPAAFQFAGEPPTRRATPVRAPLFFSIHLLTCMYVLAPQSEGKISDDEGRISYYFESCMAPPECLFCSRTRLQINAAFLPLQRIQVRVVRRPQVWRRVPRHPVLQCVRSGTPPCSVPRLLLFLLSSSEWKQCVLDSGPGDSVAAKPDWMITP